MDTVELTGAAMGLGFVAGIRLYTILALGLAIRFDWLHLPAAGRPLQILVYTVVFPARSRTVSVPLGFERLN
jgi:hypothetical protein